MITGTTCQEKYKQAIGKERQRIILPPIILPFVLLSAILVWAWRMKMSKTSVGLSLSVGQNRSRREAASVGGCAANLA